MEIYLVGGAVRDALLGRRVVERDWVVVGSSPEELIAAGYTRVGRSFPVFLHPSTREEYALARTERKVSEGHTGFDWEADDTVTLEQDLARRDLTINAMARATDGRLIDPFGGAKDLRRGLLNHVSEAFVEDPLRVYRVARFAALLPEFHVAQETSEIMAAMAASGELSALSAERVWQEWVKAMNAPATDRFFQVLDDSRAMSPWFTGVNVKRARWVLTKGPYRNDIESNGSLGWVHDIEVIEALMDRLKAPRQHRTTAKVIAEVGPVLGDMGGGHPAALLDALVVAGAFRSEEAMEHVFGVVEVCAGRSCDRLRELVTELRAMNLGQTDVEGAEYGRLLRRVRIDHIADCL